ncbi:MAG: ATP-binding protein [Roseivirga sp.]
MISRLYYIQLLKRGLQHFPVCAILGPRQCGKTTLALALKEQYDETHHFDLEDPTDLAKLADPKLALEPLKGLIIIDEIQRRPELFPYLRVWVDRYPTTRLLILGSASRELIQQSSETLAGRIRYIELRPFTLQEVGDMQQLWQRGGFPRSYLAEQAEDSAEWRKAYITTFLERDLATLGFNVAPWQMRQLWMMLAHYHGNIMNYSELGRSLGITNKTIRAHIGALEGAFMVRPLKAWYENMKKRQVKAPKIYIRDSGLLHTLLGIRDQDLPNHPKLGASWEGFALEEVIATLGVDADACYYWRTQTGVELDLLVFKDGQRLGYEFKYTDAPKLTASMRIALQDLSLDRLYVIIPGQEQFFLHEQVQVVGLKSLHQHYL